MALFGTDEYKKTQAEQSWQNYNQWSTEMDERFERDQASARVRSGASGGSSGALDLQLASIAGEYEKERAHLDAGESKKYLDDYYDERGGLTNKISTLGRMQFGRDGDQYQSKVLTEAVQESGRTSEGLSQGELVQRATDLGISYKSGPTENDASREMHFNKRIAEGMRTGNVKDLRLSDREHRDYDLGQAQAELDNTDAGTQDEFYQNLFGENQADGELDPTEGESATMRAKTAASGRQAGGTPWLN